MFGEPQNSGEVTSSSLIKRAVVVDDDDRARQALEQALSRLGFVVTIASDLMAAHCLIHYRDHQFAVVDVANGQELIGTLDALRKGTAGVRVVVLTRRASIAMAVCAVRHGAHDYIAKPCSPEAVAHSLLRASWQNDATLGNVPDACLSLRRMEWEHIQLVLRDCMGNLSRTARLLGMPRRTLQRKLKKNPVTEAKNVDLSSRALEERIVSLSSAS